MSYNCDACGMVVSSSSGCSCYTATVPTQPKTLKLVALEEKIKKLESGRNNWKNICKQPDECLVKALQYNNRRIARLEKSNNESIEIIHDLSGDNEALKDQIKKLIENKNDSN